MTQLSSRLRAGLLAFALAVAWIAAVPGASAQEAAATTEPETSATTEPDTSAPAEPDTAATTEPDTSATTEPDTSAPAEPDASSAQQTVPASQADAVDGIDFTDWEAFAGRVETALDSGRVSESVLGDLRRDLVGWRDKFAAAKDKSTVRIRALRAQIDALGPAPEDGAEEPGSIADQREALAAQLDGLLAPVTRAQLAFARADTLVAALDQNLRSRQRSDVTGQGPTPFDPGVWAPALEALARTFRLAWAAAIGSWSDEIHRPTLIADLPLTIPLGLLGLVLLLTGWRSVRRIGERVRAGGSAPVRGAWGFVISALQVIVPSIGALFFSVALGSAFILDTRGQQILAAFVALVAVQFIARWIGNRVFGIPGASWRVLELSGGRVREGHAMTATLGVMVGLQVLLNDLGRIDAYSEATMAVLNFPLIVVTSITFWRLGQLMRVYHGATEGEEDPPTNFYNRTVRFIGTLLLVIGFVAPLAAAIGYRNFAVFVLFPSIFSLALVAFLMILHHFIVDIFALITRRDRDEAAQSLLPVLVSVGVALAATPLLPLIWGYRVTDLTEFWSKVYAGFTIGGTVITPMAVLTVAVVFAFGYALTRLVQGMLGSTILPKTHIEPGGQTAITSGVGYVGIFIAAIAAVTAAGIDLSSLAIVAGALSVGIGFGLQTIVSNFVSGIILLIERPISDGDWIEVGGTMGTVKDISVRSTRIETFDRTDVIVPNSDLIAGTVTNYTRGNLLGRVIVPVGVAYGSDTKRVEQILREVAEAHPIVTINPPPQVYFMGFGADSLDFEVRVILRDVFLMLQVRSDINHEIARRFVEEGIEIPFAQRDIWLRNPEALPGASAPHVEPVAAPVADEPPSGTGSPRGATEPEDPPASHGYGPEDRDDD